MATFKVYKRDDCPYCQRALQFLATLQKQREDVQVTTVDAYKEPAKVKAVQKRVGRTTVPQIFLDGNHIGGWDDLAAWTKQGHLDHFFATGEFRTSRPTPGFFGRLLGRPSS